jgi:CTP:molybdopterin cytidylyltransferase MocA
MRAAKLNILILAAGLSTCLGQRQALLLSASMAPAGIFAVVPSRSSRYRNEAAGIKVRFVPNSKRAEGLASSVRIGIRRSRFAAAILILPVDLYALNSRDLRRLLARWHASPGVCAAARIGARGGVPIILPARTFPAAALLEGDCGFRNFLGSFTPPPELVDIPAAGLDIDTRPDLQSARLRRQRRSEAPSGPLPKRKIAKYV